MTDYTPILNIAEVATNQNMKETTINTGFTIMEGSYNDTVGIDLSSEDHDLTIDEYTKYFSMKCTGNTVPRNLNTPAASGSFTGKRVFMVENTGSADITVRPGGSGTGTVVVSAGVAAFLKCDGTSISTLSSGAAAVTGASFITLNDVPDSYTGAALNGVRVNSAADGLEFYSISNTLRGEYSGVPGASALLNLVVVDSWQLPSGLPGSRFFIHTNPTSTTTFTLNKVSGGTTTEIGTIAISSTGVFTATFASAVTFAAGDVLQVVAPSSPDATAAYIAFAFKGTQQ